MPRGSEVHVSSNDSIKCTIKYLGSWDLGYLDSISYRSDLRNFPLKNSLSEHFENHEIIQTDQTNNADFFIDFQDYWYCRRKQKLASLYIRIKDQEDSTNQALIVNKTFDVSGKLDYNKVVENSVNEFINSGHNVYNITAGELNNYPEINDVPDYPAKQIGFSFGYSLGDASSQ